MAKKLSYEIVRKNIEQNGYKLLSKEYKNSSTYLEIMCDKGHIYQTKYNVFQQGSKCPICSRKGINKKYDYMYVKNYIGEYGYKLISKKYTSCDEYLDVICNNGHNYKTTFSNFKNGYRCKECQGIKAYTYAEVKSIIKNKNYELLSGENEYENTHSIVTIKCNHGHIYDTKFYVFNSGHVCPYCTNRKLNLDIVKEYIEDKEYELLSESYKNNSELLKIKCPKGHIFDMSYNKFQYGCRCTVCNSSNGEKEISKILDKLNIKYFTYHRFEDCKGYSKTLPFDFYIYENNICIEFDGIQHFEPVVFFCGQESFIRTQLYDSIKNKYCSTKNIQLIRIPYWDFDNIENILIKQLKDTLRENFNDYIY